MANSGDAIRWPRFSVAIFSFNRGPWLSNAVSSLGLLTNALQPRAVQVHDDNSDDPATLAALNALPVALASTDLASGTARHGGLYARMQAALDTAPAGTLLLLLQDDTQIVRAPDNTDMTILSQAFERHPNLAFVSAAFVRGRRSARFRRSFRPDGKGIFLSRLDSPRDAPRNCYSDVVIAHVDRLRAAGWHFAGSEAANAEQALRLFGPMAVLATPFVAWVPEAPFFRHRRKPWIARLLPAMPPALFLPLTEARLAALRARPHDSPAIAEDWLDCIRAVRRPFVYKDVQGHRLLSGLYAAERTLRRLI